MIFIAGILTFVLVVNALMLILLILVQLPKKDAGAGLAFGSGAADALFGAGSGNVLTKVTKWATVIFVGLSVVLGVVQDKLSAHSSTSDFLQQVQKKQMQTPISAPAPMPAPASQPPVTASNAMPILLPTTAPTSTPAPSTPAK
jgi:preprotein translocase subunit SecG